MSTELQNRPEQMRLIEWARSPEAHSQIAAAVGTAIDPDQFITHMMIAFQAPEVRQCSVRSQTVAFMECAAMGLLPTLNQVKLIPYKDIIKAMPQWQGLKALMERHPDILEVEVYLVHRTDEFQFSDGEVIHSYDPLAGDRAFNGPSDIRGGYCKILYRNGRPPKFHVVTAAQITKCQKCAQTQNVWRQWYEQMALKTVLRDCYARRAVPVDPLVAARLERAFSIEDVNLGNRPDRASLPPTRTSRILSQPVNPPMDETPDELPPSEAVQHDVPHQREPGDDDEPVATEPQQSREQIEAEECLSAWREQIEGCADVTSCNTLEKESLPSAPANLRARILELLLARKASIRSARGK